MSSKTEAQKTSSEIQVSGLIDHALPTSRRTELTSGFETTCGAGIGRGITAASLHSILTQALDIMDLDVYIEDEEVIDIPNWLATQQQSQ